MQVGKCIYYSHQIESLTQIRLVQYVKYIISVACSEVAVTKIIHLTIFEPQWNSSIVYIGIQVLIMLLPEIYCQNHQQHIQMGNC